MQVGHGLLARLYDSIRSTDLRLVALSRGHTSEFILDPPQCNRLDEAEAVFVQMVE